MYVSKSKETLKYKVIYDFTDALGLLVDFVNLTYFICHLFILLQNRQAKFQMSCCFHDGSNVLQSRLQMMIFCVLFGTGGHSHSDITCELSVFFCFNWGCSLKGSQIPLDRTSCDSLSLRWPRTGLFFFNIRRFLVSFPVKMGAQNQWCPIGCKKSKNNWTSAKNHLKSSRTWKNVHVFLCEPTMIWSLLAFKWPPVLLSWNNN